MNNLKRLLSQRGCGRRTLPGGATLHLAMSVLFLGLEHGSGAGSSARSLNPSEQVHVNPVDGEESASS